MPLPSLQVLWGASDLEREIDEAFDRWLETPWRRGQGLTGWPAVDLYDVDEGLELLGGIPAGRLDEADTFHGRVDQRLRELAAAMKEQRAASFEREFPLWEPAGNGPRDPRPTLPGRE